MKPPVPPPALDKPSMLMESWNPNTWKWKWEVPGHLCLHIKIKIIVEFMRWYREREERRERKREGGKMEGGRKKKKKKNIMRSSSFFPRLKTSLYWRSVHGVSGTSHDHYLGYGGKISSNAAPRHPSLLKIDPSSLSQPSLFILAVPSAWNISSLQSPTAHLSSSIRPQFSQESFSFCVSSVHSWHLRQLLMAVILLLCSSASCYKIKSRAAGVRVSSVHPSVPNTERSGQDIDRAQQTLENEWICSQCDTHEH